MKEYTMEEVQKHNKENDLWLVIDGNVYDVTNFLSNHPGGINPLLNRGGQDVSTYFHNITKHKSNAEMSTLMKSMLIGKVVKPIKIRAISLFG